MTDAGQFAAPGPPSEPSAEHWFEVNRELWDERVPIHVASELYDVEAFVAGRSSLRAFELAELTGVGGRTLVHPQCHFGEDTLSWARLGAHVTGLDFSGPAVAAACELAARCDLTAEFVEANVYDAAEALGGRRFDIVYTGLGALNWLPDVERWARVMASLTVPGGCLYLAEFHPFSHVFSDHDLTVQYPYFQTEPFVFPNTGSYADSSAPTVHNRAYEWNHGLGAVVSAVIAAGFELEFLHEHDSTLHLRWRFLIGERGSFRLPEGMPSLPLMYSLRAVLRG
jgi:SAM-dependent methyltransferase